MRRTRSAEPRSPKVGPSSGCADILPISTSQGRFGKYPVAQIHQSGPVDHGLAITNQSDADRPSKRAATRSKVVGNSGERRRAQVSRSP